MFRRFCSILFALLAIAIRPAAAQVIWEDFQGTQGILGTSNGDKAGPNYDNNSGYTVAELAALRSISAATSNATRSGTSTTINYRAAGGIAGGSVDAFATLCNSSNPAAGTGYDGPGTGSACANDAQGRVMYTLVKFPYTGTYTFGVSHDDAIDLDLSTDYTNTAYKTAVYDIAVGDAPSYTADENTYDTLAGIFSSPTANACILLRLYWNNNGGLNYLRLRWTRPNISGGGTTTEIVPTTYLFDPGSAASSAGCSGSVGSTNTSMVLNKAIASTGRADATDQFTVTITDNAVSTIVSSATTAGAGTGQQASTGASIITNGTVYRMTDSMATGSFNTLAAYNPTIACTRAGISYTPTALSTGVWTASTSAANQQIVCSITNSRKSAQLQLRKTWVNAVINDALTLPATTGFNTNTVSFNSVANTANESDTGAAVTVLVGDNGTLGAEVLTTGAASSYTPVLSCSAGTLSGTNAQAANTLLVPAAAAGTTILCTYTNAYRPPLTFTKSSVLFSGSTPAYLIPGNDVLYTLSVSNTTANPITANSIFIVDPLPTTMTFFNGDANGPAAGTDVVIYTDVGSGLTAYNYAADVRYATLAPANFAACSYTPTAGYDLNVKYICLNPKGSMLAKTGAATPAFSYTFRARIN